MTKEFVLQAAKAALVNFYETLRFEVKNDIGITIATRGWVGGDMTGGRFLLEEGAEMQWKEEREVGIIVIIIMMMKMVIFIIIFVTIFIIIFFFVLSYAMILYFIFVIIRVLLFFFII